MDRLATNYPAVTGKLREDQIAHMSTWTPIPDAETTIAALSSIHVIPRNGSTVTHVNPIDPGYETGRVRNPPMGWDRVIPVNLP